MRLRKAHVLDRFISMKVAAGPSAVPAAHAALRVDPDYRELKRRLEASGCFVAARAAYTWRAILLLLVLAAGWAGMAVAGATELRVAGVVAVGVASVVGAFLAHDAGHGAVTRRPRVVGIIGHVYATVAAGFAFNYHRRSHDLHHFHTNEETVDPDCISDLVSVHERAAHGATGIGRRFTRHQALLVPLVFPIWALSMRIDGLAYAVRNHRRCRVDLLGLALHVVLWLAIPAILIGPITAAALYLAHTAVAGLYLGAIIPVNHVAMTYLPPGHTLPFFHHQLATCRNIRTPRWPLGAAVVDFLFLGLDRQIEHHLFPSTATFRLARAAPVVRQFCQERGLPYHETTYTQAIGQIWRHFARIGRITAVPLPRVSSTTKSRA
jgi:fatty acid desaturase